MWPFRRKKNAKVLRTSSTPAPDAGTDWTLPMPPLDFLAGPSNPDPVDTPPAVTDYGSTGIDSGGGDFSCGGDFGGGGGE
jgi:hypothetical protein